MLIRLMLGIHYESLPFSFFVEALGNHCNGAVEFIVEFRFGIKNSIFKNFFFVSDEEPQMIKHFLTVI